MRILVGLYYGLFNWLAFLLYASLDGEVGFGIALLAAPIIVSLSTVSILTIESLLHWAIQAWRR